MNNKILALSRLPFPHSIIILITEFAYYDIEKLAKSRIKLIVASINHSSRYTRDPEEFIYWIESDPMCKQFQCEFCTKCGGYIALSSIIEKLHSSCNCSCID
jgi:hypothetical protein